MSQPEENREKSPKTDAVLNPRELRHPPNVVPRRPAANPDDRVQAPARPAGAERERDEGGSAESSTAQEET